MKPYGIFSPTLGLKQDFPSILLKEAYTSDIQDVFFQKGEVWRIKKRIQEFAYQFEDKILSINYYYKDSTNEWWLVVFTKRDVAYRDINNDRFNFINKIYNQGTISNAIQNSGNTFTLTFSLPSGENLQNEVKAGDFIRLSNNASPYTSDDTWYEIASVDSATQITCNGSLPSGYSVPSGGDDYAIRKTFSGGDFDFWSVITYNEKLLASNNGIDNIIKWEGAGQVTDLSCSYKAKHLYKYNNRVLLGKTIESGQEYPFRVRWSGLGDETDWGGSGSDAGSMEIDEGSGTVQQFANLKGFLYIVKDKAIIRAWNVEGSTVFNKKLVVNIGSDAPRSVIETEDYIYFWCSDNTFRKFNGLTATVISDEITDIVTNINPNYQAYIEATFIQEYNQILWAIPEGTSETNNKVVVYDLDFIQNNWGVIDMEVSAFGSYELEETYDWASLPFANWVDWTWDSWKYRAGLQSFPIDIMGTYDGKIHRLNADEKDLGADYTGHIVLETSLSENKRTLVIYKRLLKIDVYVRKETTGSLYIDIKRDDEADWQTAGSVSLTGDEDILVKKLFVSYLARVYKIKIYATNRFRLVGLVLWSSEVGAR